MTPPYCPICRQQHPPALTCEPWEERQQRLRHAGQRYKPCPLGVGCEEAGICYAAANGRPEECGMEDESDA